MRKLKKEIWPYQTLVSASTVGPEDWCLKNLGYRFKHWYSYKDEPSAIIYAFKEEATLIMFKLTWNTK